MLLIKLSFRHKKKVVTGNKLNLLTTDSYFVHEFAISQQKTSNPCNVHH